MTEKLKCWIGWHWWTVHQELFLTHRSAWEVVIAWKQCRRCGASRLIHILK